jgi:hypothetical protein
LSSEPTDPRLLPTAVASHAAEVLKPLAAAVLNFIVPKDLILELLNDTLHLYKSVSRLLSTFFIVWTHSKLQENVCPQ